MSALDTISEVLEHVQVNRTRPTSRLTVTERNRLLEAITPVIEELESKASNGNGTSVKQQWNGFSPEGGPVIRADSKGDVITAWVMREGFGEVQGTLKSLTFRDADNKAVYYSVMVPTSSGIRTLTIIHDSKKDAVEFQIPVEEEEETAEENE